MARPCQSRPGLDTIGFAGSGRLFADIKSVGGLGLHLEGHFEGGDFRFQLAVAVERPVMHFVELLHQIELFPLFRQGDVLIPQVLDDLVHITGIGIDTGALEPAGEEHGLPVGRATIRQIGATQRDESWQIFIQGPQPVECPASHAGTRQAERSGIHEDGGGFVGRDIGPHGADYRHLIHHFPEVGEHFADFDPGLPLFGEFKRRTKGQSVAARKGLAVEPLQLRFMIPGIDVGGRPFEEDMDDMFGLGGKMQGLPSLGGGQQAAGALGFRRFHQTRQTQHPESHPGALKELAAGGNNVIRRKAGEMLGDEFRGGVHGGIWNGWGKGIGKAPATQGVGRRKIHEVS